MSDRVGLGNTFVGNREAERCGDAGAGERRSSEVGQLLGCEQIADLATECIGQDQCNAFIRFEARATVLDTADRAGCQTGVLRQLVDTEADFLAEFPDRMYGQGDHSNLCRRTILNLILT